MHTATKEFRFEAAHCLDGHKGKCKNLHGHNYVVYVTLSDRISTGLNDMDMVMDFYDLNTLAKPLFDKFDHAFLYNTTCKDSFEKEIRDVCVAHDRKIVELPIRFTAENMAEYFYNELIEMLNNENCFVDSVKVYETATSYAVYNGR